jgi:hypothetical protein
MKITMKKTAVATLLFLIVAPVSVNAQVYLVDNIFEQGRNLPYLENDYGHRITQVLDTGNRPDLNQTANTCNAAGARLVCGINSRISSRDDTYTDLAITVNCLLDSQIAFDFRRAKGCTCGAQAVPSDTGVMKECPCVVCPDGYGSSPVSIDCSGNDEDPYVINTCTSMDCDFSCNGTCSYDCVDAGPECAFCFNATEAPTGEDDENSRATLTPVAPTTSGALAKSTLHQVSSALAALALVVTLFA